jgi:hypothetical protein
MNVQEQITKVTESLSKDKDLLAQFQKDPAAALKKITGLDLPKDAVDQVVEAVKTKLTADKLKNTAEGALNTLKKHF